MDIKKINRLLDPKRLLPPGSRVLKIEAQNYVDSLGEDSLRIDVLLDDSITDDEIAQNRLRPIDDAITGALRKAGVQLFPYIFWARESELAEEEEEFS